MLTSKDKKILYKCHPYLRLILDTLKLEGDLICTYKYENTQSKGSQCFWKPYNLFRPPVGIILRLLLASS